MYPSMSLPSAVDIIINFTGVTSNVTYIKHMALNHPDMKQKPCKHNPSNFDIDAHSFCYLLVV